MNVLIKRGFGGLLFPFVLIVLSACENRMPANDRLKEALHLAGKNRRELKKVLDRYEENEADSLKLRAAVFLIENMPGKYSEYYDAPWNDVSTAYLRWSSSSDRQSMLNTYRLGKPVVEEDLKHITADYLIENIELAFKVWNEVPWGKDVPFDIFCEQILPYRMGTEPLENWREKALSSFADEYNSFMKNDTLTAVEACTRLNILLPRFRVDKDYPDMSFSQLMATSRGSCESMVAAAAFSMRALGIPVSWDYTSKWPNMTHGHSWNSVYDGKRGSASFMGAETNPGLPHEGITRPKFKVFRHTFGRNQNIDAAPTDIPIELQNQYMIDVSSEYEDCMDIEVPKMFQPVKPTDHAYLAVLSQNEWKPIAWGRQEQTKIHYSGVGKELLYLPVYYADEKQTPANYPFIVEADGSCRFLVCDSVQNVLALDAIDMDTKNFLPLMLHGRFEGANRPDFSDARVLYRIDEVRGGFYHTASVGSDSEYRYIRYFSPDSGRCNVAELEFHNKDGEKLTGIVIGMPGSNEKMASKNAFDGDVATTVNVDSLHNAWIGLDLGKPSAIGKIRFLPRTHGNNIYEGHRYRLNYWDGHRWVALKEQTATSHRLHYPAPARALFYLQNLTRGTKGRYFMLENGTQRWFDDF